MVPIKYPAVTVIGITQADKRISDTEMLSLFAKKPIKEKYHILIITGKTTFETPSAVRIINTTGIIVGTAAAHMARRGLSFISLYGFASFLPQFQPSE